MNGSSFSAHFGGASHFRIVEADRTSRCVLSQTDVEAPEHVPGVFPEWLGRQGVQAVIVGAIGKRAVQVFAASGIPVFLAQPGLMPEELVSRQLEGGLSHANMDDCCSGHGHDHGDHCH